MLEQVNDIVISVTWLCFTAMWLKGYIRICGVQGSCAKATIIFSAGFK
jgi:hypothetical protein